MRTCICVCTRKFTHNTHTYTYTRYIVCTRTDPAGAVKALSMSPVLMGVCRSTTAPVVNCQVISMRSFSGANCACICSMCVCLYVEVQQLR